MNSIIKLNKEEISTRIKIKKNTIMKQEQETQQKIEEFYNALRNAASECQRQTISAFNRQVLAYYEKSTEVLEMLNKIDQQQNSEDLEFAEEFLNYKINDRPAIRLEKLMSIMRKAFPVTINNKPQPDHRQILKFILEEEQSLSQSQDMTSLVIEKLQCERDYYQKRQSQLEHKIKQMETNFAKRGVNIKQMSRSYLQDKCSKFALERLTQEKKILVERIGEASQQIIRLNSQLGDLQHEMRKINGTIYEGNKSLAGGSSLKANSVFIDETRNEKNLENEQRKERELQLELKNQQLMIEVTHLIKQLEELSEANGILESRIENDQQKVKELKDSLQSLKENNQCLNHDYQISLKRKAAFEQECRSLKAQLSKLNEQSNEERETYKHIILDLESKQEEVVERVKQIEENKKIEINKLEVRLKEVIEEKEKLMKIMNENSAKKGEQTNYKALLNDEITRLLKETSLLSQQLALKEQKLFQESSTNRKLQKNLKNLEKKAEDNKKEYSKLKKINKQLEKQIGQLQKKIENNESIELKLAQIEQNYSTLTSEFNKVKELTDRRTGLHQKILTHLKDKFALQLSTLLNQEPKGKSAKKNNNKFELIQKYIQEMATLSGKTAQIKQLKEQLKELKESKQAKILTKRGKGLSLEQSTMTLQSGVLFLNTKIMQERLNSEKQLFSDQIKELNQKLQKQQLMNNSLQQELQKQRIAVVEMRSKQKQQVCAQDKTKLLRQKEEKIQKLQNQLKVSRANCRKLQNDNNEIDSQLKTKRQLCIGLKKQCQQKEGIIKQISVELSITQEELERMKRNQKEVSKKQTMFKDIKQKKQQTNQENASLKKTIQSMEDRIKLLNKQLAKKDEHLREARSIEEKQIKIKEEGKLKEAFETIAGQKEIIRKMKMEIERKDQIIKNTKEKVENKVKNLEGRALSKEKENQKTKKELELLERKIETAKNNYKREQNRNYLLVVLIKKIFQMCVSSQHQQPLRVSQNRQSIHYGSTSTLTPLQVKPNTVSNLMKTSQICEGLQILDLKPQDLEGLMGQTTICSKVSPAPHQASWSMVSPIVCKSSESLKHQQLISGLQQLQKLISQKQLSSGQVLQLFRRAMRAQ